jgi:hypothetical protein
MYERSTSCISGNQLLTKDQCYWSQQDGNGTSFWKDAALTSKGNDQALAANRFWNEAVNTLKIPIPGTLYTSPLARCLTTINLTFSGVPLGSHGVPVVKEVSQQSNRGDTKSSSFSGNQSTPVLAPGVTARRGSSKTSPPTKSSPDSLTKTHSGPREWKSPAPHSVYA